MGLKKRMKQGLKGSLTFVVTSGLHGSMHEQASTQWKKDLTSDTWQIEQNAPHFYFLGHPTGT